MWQSARQAVNVCLEKPRRWVQSFSKLLGNRTQRIIKFRLQKCGIRHGKDGGRNEERRFVRLPSGDVSIEQLALAKETNLFCDWTWSDQAREKEDNIHFCCGKMKSEQFHLHTLPNKSNQLSKQNQSPLSPLYRKKKRGQLKVLVCLKIRWCAPFALAAVAMKNLFLYSSGVQSCAMEGREYAGFHSNQSLHQLILLMNTSSIREEGTN